MPNTENENTVATTSTEMPATAPAATIQPEAMPVPDAATPEAASQPAPSAKRLTKAERKLARKLAAKHNATAKAKPGKSKAKPQAEKPDTSEALAMRREARAIAAKAVSEYYNGASLPFKAAADRFADLRTDKAPKQPTQRQAALLAAMLTCDTTGNIKRNGSFIRGGFHVPKRLFDPDADASATCLCQPETGCLSDMLGRTISYVSGPISGKAQAETVLQINLKAAAAEISAMLGGTLAHNALAAIEARGIKLASTKLIKAS